MITTPPKKIIAEDCASATTSSPNNNITYLNTSNNSVPVPSDEQPKLTIQQIDPSIAVRPLNRERAKTYLQDVVQKSGSNENPIEIEAKIFEASKSILYEYINALCHKRVLLENTSKRILPENQNQITSKKRKLDELSVQCEPNPKKHKTTPYFQWFYSDNQFKITKLSIKDNEVLESHFLTGPPVFPYQFEFEKQEKQVDVENNIVEGGNIISRKLFVLDRELIPPPFWTPKQSNIFHSFDLPTDSLVYMSIAEKFRERIPNASICFIRQLQHIINYQRYSFQRNLILHMHEAIDPGDNGEKQLYFGSKKTVPRTIILDRDGFDNFNTLSACKFYEDPFLADQDAFVIVNAQTRAQNCQKKQIIVALVAVGNSKEISDSEANLKRPPLKHTVNGMDQIYDSTWRHRMENGFPSKEYLIQNKFQAYASFLIDYNIPSQ